MIGEFPGLAKLDEDGNLRATADFRGLYGAMLEDWLGTDAEAIIPGARKFARPEDPAMRRTLAVAAVALRWRLVPRRCLPQSRHRHARRCRPTSSRWRSRAQSIRARPGDRRARQLRRGRPRPRPPPDRRDADLSHRDRASRRDRRARDAATRRPLRALVHARRPSHPWHASDVARQAECSLTAPAPFLSCDRRRAATASA